MSVIPAAGTIPWRLTDGVLEVALVHRPGYDDWSWPKGKLDTGEQWPVAAARETEEETGLVCGLGIPLPEIRYPVIGRQGAPDDKVVRYWAARVLGGHGRLENEIDEVAWLPTTAAYERLDYARDREQLLAIVREHQARRLDTWPFLLIRHAKAVARSAYTGPDDRLRPLDARGMGRAGAIVPLLAAYGVSRVESSPSTRCVQTVAPYAAAESLPVHTRAGLSEEGYAADPTKAPRRMAKLLRRGRPVALSSHGPVLPALVAELRRRVDDEAPAGADAAALLEAAAEERLAKGEVLVAHLVGAGDAARVVSVERHLP